MNSGTDARRWRLTRCSDEVSLARTAAETVVAAAVRAHAERGRFLWCLSGGKTPRALYELLATAAWVRRIDWTKTEVAFGDERCVPMDHEESNYHMVWQALLRHVPLPPHAIHRIEAEREPLVAAARYESRLKSLLLANSSGAPASSFDLVLLGLGTDAHTASLFPYSVDEPDRWVSARRPGREGPARITLTPIALNAAALALFLVAGSEKAMAVKQVLEGPRDSLALPAQRIEPRGELVWLVDAAAAALLDAYS